MPAVFGTEPLHASARILKITVSPSATPGFTSVHIDYYYMKGVTKVTRFVDLEIEEDLSSEQKADLITEAVNAPTIAGLTP